MKKTKLIISAFAFVGFNAVSFAAFTGKAQAQYRYPSLFNQLANSCFCRYAGLYDGRDMYFCCNDRTGRCFYSQEDLNYC